METNLHDFRQVTLSDAELARYLRDCDAIDNWSIAGKSNTWRTAAGDPVCVAMYDNEAPARRVFVPRNSAHPVAIGARLDDYRPEWASIVESVKADIEDEFRAFEDDTAPSIQLTIATDDTASEWSYQTGDNCYTGGAYGLPHWAVVGVYRDSNPANVAEEIADQLANLIFQ